MDTKLVEKLENSSFGCRECGPGLFAGMKDCTLINDLERTAIQIESNSRIFLEGEEHNYAYTINTGWAILYREHPESNKRQILRFLLPGDLFGFELINQRYMAQSAKSLTTTTIYRFNRMQLKSVISQHPKLFSRLIEIESHDICLCHYHMTLLGRKTAKERIAFILLELFFRVKQQHIESYNPVDRSIFFPLTQNHLADSVGLTSIHVHRVLKMLNREKLIEISRKRLRIFQPQKLSEIAEFSPDMVLSPIVE